jgi:hypothetical protein
MQSLAAETGAESQAARPCVVFVNGEYWGLHYLKEKEDVEFVGYYGDVPGDGLDYLEGYATAKAGDTAHYDQLLALVAAGDLSDPEVFAEIAARMDLENFTDYKACEIFFYRWDIGNHRLWRPRAPEGRWRWLQFDNDVGWGGFWAAQPAWEFDMLQADLTPSGSLHGHNNETTTFLFRRLIEQAAFRDGFVNRFADLLNTVFAPAHTQARIETMVATLEPEMAEHIRRWRSPATLTEWRNHVDYLRTYARQRPAFAREHLARHFGLRGLAQLALSVSDPRAGRIRLNSIDCVAPTNAPWSGLYFLGRPIRLTALALPGYRFAGWRGLPGVATNQITVQLNGDLAVTAEFLEEPPPPTLLRLVQTEGTEDWVLEIVGPPQARCWLEEALDLGAWTAVEEVRLGATGKATGTPSPTASAARRFYRVRVESVP